LFIGCLLILLPLADSAALAALSNKRSKLVICIFKNTPGEDSEEPLPCLFKFQHVDSFPVLTEIRAS
jgi:hypothetical protein